MKKFYSLLAVVVITATVSAQTATQVVNEPFDFTGKLNANGWVTHSGTAGQLVSDGNAAKLVAGDSEDVNKAFSTVYQIEAGKKSEVNYFATIEIASGTGLSTAGDYFLTLASTAGTNVTSLYARLFVKGSATGYSIGILNNSGGTATPTFGDEIAYGLSANIAVNYTIDNTLATPTNVASLQINAQPLITNASGTAAAPTTLSSVAIRQAGSGTKTTGNISIDNLTVTTVSATLAVGDVNAAKVNFVKNTVVANTIMFAAKADVQILNMNGQVVKTASVSENTSLDVAALPKGIYIVNGMLNGKAVSQKIMKK